MHKGQGYDHRKAPHSPSTNDNAEINECGKLMGDGKSTSESDYAMDEGPIHGGGKSSNPKKKMDY